MKHLQAILYKFLIIAVSLGIVLSILTDLSFGQILLISATVTIIAYIIGDIGILPMSNNTIATLVDFALAWLIIYAFNYYYRIAEISISDAFWGAAVIAVGEWLFHKYVSSSVITDKEEV